MYEYGKDENYLQYMHSWSSLSNNYDFWTNLVKGTA